MDVMEPDAAPVRPGEDLDWAALEAYLRAHVADLTGDFSVAQFPNGAANLTYLVRFGNRRLVVRRPPFGQLAPGSHDMRREFRTLSRLFASYPRAPQAFAFCDEQSVIGADFLVMEYRPGVVVWASLPAGMQGLPDAAARLAGAVVDALADLHLVRPESCGLEDLGRPDGFVRRQVEGWTRRWELVAGDPDPLMDSLPQRLAATMPDSPRYSLLHNDFKIDNCQFAPDDPDRVVSVFDWDMATLGDPLVDLGILLNYWPDPADPDDQRVLIVPGIDTLGLPGRGEVERRYAARTGFDLGRVSWYQAFAAWKTAVVLRQLYARWLRGESADPRMEVRGERAGPLARRAHAILDGA
jgi:aminoglycoside phosphotransferase (APT) family kinase protein